MLNCLRDAHPTVLHLHRLHHYSTHSRFVQPTSFVAWMVAICIAFFNIIASGPDCKNTNKFIQPSSWPAPVLSIIIVLFGLNSDIIGYLDVYQLDSRMIDNINVQGYHMTSRLQHKIQVIIIALRFNHVQLITVGLAENNGKDVIGQEVGDLWIPESKVLRSRVRLARLTRWAR